MGLVNALPGSSARSSAHARQAMPDVAVLEDEPNAADLAAEVCGRLGLQTRTYRTPTAFLADFRAAPPRMVILDWRLEREVGAAVFMALRHRFPEVPIVCWTGLDPAALPSMVAADSASRVVRKASALDALEEAIRWGTGTETEAERREETGHDGGIQDPARPAPG